MLTGDNRITAEAVAREAGIDEVIAGVLPEGRVDAIRTLQAGKHMVAMVGDGVNDAPALAQADAGITMATGSGIEHHWHSNRGRRATSVLRHSAKSGAHERSHGM